jgi:Protein of unknown function VcgC/VcgE (DUF2780)
MLRASRSHPCGSPWSRDEPFTSTGELEMSDTPNAVSSETGLSTDLVHKGLGAVLDFLRQHLSPETFERVQSAIPDAGDFLNRFESSPKATGGGGLLGALTDLAAKFLGGGAGELTKLMENFATLGFKPEQIEAFLPRAVAFIQSHLPADLFQQILARFPALAEVMGPKAE